VAEEASFRTEVSSARRRAAGSDSEAASARVSERTERLRSVASERPRGHGDQRSWAPRDPSAERATRGRAQRAGWPGGRRVRRARSAAVGVAWGAGELCSPRTTAGGYGNPPRVPIKTSAEERSRHQPASAERPPESMAAVKTAAQTSEEFTRGGVGCRSCICAVDA
jgi:hypothetical protein